MDSKKKPSSSSSFTAELFGPKESPPSSSSGIFASIFPPPNKVVRRKSLSCEGIGSWQKQPSPFEGLPGSATARNKERKSVFVEERGEPCHLSSSLYYGGRENYSQPPNATQPSGSYPMLNKDGGEDDDPNLSSAYRGNWWQGSLYY